MTLSSWEREAAATPRRSRHAQLGKSVALIEKDKVGGTCLHVGCIPTKALLHSAEVADVTRESAKYGVTSQFGGIDIAAVTAYREGIVASKWKGLQGLIKARGITTIEGAGRLTSPTTVQVGEQTITGKNVVLATGSYSRSLPGLEIGGRVITSEQALALDFVPKKVAVLGGGVIGVEFSSVWKSWGAEVTIIEALPHLVPNEDESISKHVRARVPPARHRLQGRRALRGRHPERDRRRRHARERRDRRGRAAARRRRPRPARRRTSATKRSACTMDRGFVITDERLQTNVPGVYAVGDIVPGLQLAHRGFQQGIFVAEEIAGLDPIVVEDVNIPKVTYSDPEVASVGLTEAKAVEKYGAENITAVRLQPRRQRQEPHHRHLRRRSRSSA